MLHAELYYSDFIVNMSLTHQLQALRLASVSNFFHHQTKKADKSNLKLGFFIPLKCVFFLLLPFSVVALVSSST